MSLRNLRLLSFACAGLFAACAGDNPVTPEDLIGSDIRLVSGGDQSAQVRATLGDPVVLEVRDLQGRPLRGAEIYGEAVTGGRVSPERARTNNEGRASFQVTTSTIAGAHVVRFSLPTGAQVAPVEISYIATAGAAARLEAGGGQDQIAPIGSTLRDPPAARVTDRDGNPVAGVAVRWTVRTGGGTTTGATSSSDQGGLAAMSWTLGSLPGTQTLEASVGATILTFRATAVTSTDLVPERLEIVSGDQQDAGAGATAPAPLVVRVVNAGGYGVANVPVRFTAIGGGSVVTTTPTSTPSGQASALRTMGPSAGTQTTLVTVAGVIDTLVFTHTVRAGRVTQLSFVSGQGDRVTAPGSTVGEPIVVQARDAFGNNAVGRPVSLEFAGGRGSASPTVPTTNANGQASFSWTVGTQAGRDTVTIRMEDAAPLRVVANLQATNASSLTSAMRTSRVASQFPSAAFRVRVADALGNPVNGVAVSWSLVSGSGVLTGTVSTSSGDGIATAPFTPGAAGTVTLQAALATGGTTVTLTGTTVSATMSLLPGSTPQTVTIGSTSGPMGVRIADNNQNGIRDVYVEVAQAPVGGTPPQGSLFTTDSTGRVSFAFSTGTQAVGMQQILLRSGATEAPIALRLVGPAGESAIQIVSGGMQTVRLGQPWSAPIVVRAVNPEGGVVNGARVAFSIVSGGGSLPQATVVTDGQGLAQITPTAPNSGTTQVLRARLLDAPDSVQIVGTLDASGLPSSMIAITGNGATGVVSEVLSTPLTAQVLDGSGAPIANVQVSWSVLTGGGSVTPAVSTTDNNGFATTSRRLGQNAGAQSTRATIVTAPGVTVDFTHTAVDALRPVFFEIPPGQEGNFQTAAAGDTLPFPITVVVLNAARQPVANTMVEFRVAGGGGIVSSLTGGPALVSTDAQGRAQARWRLGTTIGMQAVTASIPSWPSLGNLTISATSFDPINPVGDYTLEIVTGSDGQTGEASSLLGTSYRVRVRHANSGALASGVQVLYSALTGGPTAGLSTAPLGPFTPSLTLTSNANGEVLAWYRTGTWPTDGGGDPVPRSQFSWDVLVTVQSSTTTTPTTIRAYLTAAP